MSAPRPRPEDETPSAPGPSFPALVWAGCRNAARAGCDGHHKMVDSGSVGWAVGSSVISENSVLNQRHEAVSPSAGSILTGLARGPRSHVPVFIGAAKQMGQLVHVHDLSIPYGVERDDLGPDRIAVGLLGVDHMDIGDGRAVNDDRLDGRAAAAQGFLERARVVEEAVEVEASAIDILNIVGRKISIEALGVLPRVEQAREGILDQRPRLLLRQSWHVTCPLIHSWMAEEVDAPDC